ncbi:MAG: hypothetical protein IJ840_06710 [Bacteroidales bacterium]|nr:hypothetical protein [Bacteroidales bacterium]
MGTALARKKTQTIFRFEDSLISKLKYYAKMEEKSLNAYVEAILQTEINRREALPELSISGTYSPTIDKLSGILAGKITREDLDKDDKLAYILGK